MRRTVAVAMLVAALVALVVPQAFGAATIRDSIISVAYAQLGDPYVWGAAGPSSFDCSGLVSYCYDQAFDPYGKAFSRVDCDGLWARCDSVSESSLIKGDLVFLGSSTNKTHVGLYAGGGLVVHASSSAGKVVETTLSSFNPSYCGRVKASYWPQVAGSISISSPLNGDKVAGIVDVTASASDANTINYVQFYRDGTNVVDDSSSPYTWGYDLDGASVGNHTLDADMVDLLGGWTYASAITVNRVSYSRLAGTDRYATAAAISRNFYPSTAGCVVLVRGESDYFADAMIAAPFARQKGGPVLYVTSTSLPSATSAEIARLKPTKIYVIGGTASVSDAVLNAAKAAAGTSPSGTRIAGADRYATSVEVWKSMAKPSGVVIVSGTQCVDALAAASGAAYKGYAVMLTQPTALPGTVALALTDPAVNTVLVVGGTSSVSDTVYNAINEAHKHRVAGADRYATAAAVADHHDFNLTGGSPFIVNGEDPAWTDGFVASRFAGANPTLLVRGTSTPDATRAELDSRTVSSLYLIGGENTVRGCNW